MCNIRKDKSTAHISQPIKIVEVFQNVIPGNKTSQINID